MGTKVEMGVDGMMLPAEQSTFLYMDGHGEHLNCDQDLSSFNSSGLCRLGLFLLREEREPFKMTDIADHGKWGLELDLICYNKER